MSDTREPAANWRQITVTTAHAAMAEAVFEHFGAAAITQLDVGDEPTVEQAPHTQPEFQRSRVVGLFPADIAVDAVKHDLLDALGSTAHIEVDSLAAQDWTNAWTAHHPPLHFGGRLWVAPHGSQVCVHSHDDIVLRLDPGLAFGTGTHPTTALCLAWLAQTDLTELSVLDYGCGSGILAIAAALLGAREVCAVDIDEQAMRATRENAAANRVAGRIATPPIDAPNNAQYDIVLANILARPLVELAPTLTTLTRGGGQLVLSGLLQRQVEMVQAAYSEHFSFDPAAQQEEWMRLDGTRNATNTD